MRKLQHTFIEIGGQPVPAKVYQEYRNNVRVSIGKTAAILRLPIQMDKKQKKNQFGWFTRWVEKQLMNSEMLRKRFFPKIYQTGDTLQVGKRTYQLVVTSEDRKTFGANLKGNTIHLKLVKDAHPLSINKSAKTLLSRVIGKDFHPEINQRVHELNQEYFQKDIKGVHLKYNSSNWGSCSTRNNINLSTRLLFAPDDVIDYVIIHELTHLIEMNHSDKFWKIVQSVMPDYKEKEQWLKVNGPSCDF
ncbi:MAG: M48 family metallopeptidase [Bacteroidota bacterium]